MMHCLGLGAGTCLLNGTAMGQTLRQRNEKTEKNGARSRTEGQQEEKRGREQDTGGERSSRNRGIDRKEKYMKKDMGEKEKDKEKEEDTDRQRNTKVEGQGDTEGEKRVREAGQRERQAKTRDREQDIDGGKKAWTEQQDRDEQKNQHWAAEQRWSEK